METLNLNVNVENLTDEEREMLMKLVEKSQGKKNKIWKPKKGETYWTICSRTILNAEWYDHVVDIERYEYGEIYKTREEAEEEAVRRKMVAKWKMLSTEAGEEENKWDADGHNSHWRIYYDSRDDSLVYECNKWFHQESTYFPTKEALDTAITEFGKDNLKKYIFGVKD